MDGVFIQNFTWNNLLVKVYCCSRHSGFWDPKDICTINHKVIILQNQTMDQAWGRGGGHYKVSMDYWQ